MNFFLAVGIIITISLIVYVVLFILYKIKKPEADPVIDEAAMPKLMPVPIPTAQYDEWLPKVLTWIFSIRTWQLTENWRYKLSDKDEIIIPKGFTFDGASIPRPLWSILSPIGLLLIPGLIHDYGYRHNMLWKINDDTVIPFAENSNRQFWDELFLKVSLKINGLVLINILAWLALTLGAGYTWRRRRKEHHEPEKPVL